MEDLQRKVDLFLYIGHDDVGVEIRVDKMSIRISLDGASDAHQEVLFATSKYFVLHLVHRVEDFWLLIFKFRPVLSRLLEPDDVFRSSKTPFFEHFASKLKAFDAASTTQHNE